MRAVAVFPAERRMELIDHPAPLITRDTEVELRILDVGVCGTDREIARFDYGEPPPGETHLVIGHESLGEVVNVGSAVQTLLPGDLAVTTVRRPCGLARCPACRIGRQDFCTTLEYKERGIRGLHGFMTERIVDDAGYMHRVPTQLREIGVLVEPLTVAEKALREVVDVQTRLPWLHGDSAAAQPRNALVLGAGPVALLGTLALLVRGFRTWVFSREASESKKAAWAASVGAQFVSSAESSPRQLIDRVGDIDFVYEAAGAAPFAFHCLEALGPNGIFVFSGVPGRRGPIKVEGSAIMRNLVLKNQIVYGTVNAGPQAFRNAIEDLAEFDRRWPEQVRALISARHRPEDYASVVARRPSGIKHVISFV
jgi:threonine dehydrogenase-like Zn-dependent dehydrogenase